MPLPQRKPLFKLVQDSAVQLVGSDRIIAYRPQRFEPVPMTDTGQELSIPPEAAAPAPGTPSLAQVAPPQAPAGIINHRAPLRRLATQAVDLSVLDALGDQSDEEKQLMLSALQRNQ
jgi:hypothetical protein